MPAFAAVLFDLDGVVINSEEQHIEAISQTLHAAGIPSKALDHSSFVGKSDHAILTGLAVQMPELNLDVEALLADKNERYAQVVSGIQLVPTVLDTLHFLRSEAIPTALVTASIRRDQILAFEQFDLGPLFDVVITSDDVTHTKPDPEPYQTAARRLQVDPAQCIVLEDSLNGIRAGSAAGCHVIAITTSFDPPPLFDAGAHDVFATHGEIRAFLQAQLATQS